MRETITIHVGQCGNQIGNQFWSQMLHEHENTPDSDDAMSAFFRFSPQGNGRTQVMKARALLIDMECGPLQETMRSPLGSLFDDTQFVMDVYGAGNNFAHGHFEYGPQYRSKFEEGLRKNAEHCDSLQTFFVTHSLSGGTGSGVGTYVLGMLNDLYPEIYRFAACVFPSEDNDVVTSPYNSVLATKELIEHADCVLPIDNCDLQSFAAFESSHKSKISGRSRQLLPDIPHKTIKDRGFDDMNAIAARMMCHLTCSSRFHGEMNVDLNEICTNLIPFPKLHFLMTALSPQRTPAVGALHSGTNSGSIGATTNSSSSRNVMQRSFNDLLSRNGQINGADPLTNGCVTISTAFIARGAPSHVRLSDFLNCVTNAQKSLTFPKWNQDACKIGMCSTPAPGEYMSVLGVYNSTAFNKTIARERGRFEMLFRRKAMLHHYLEFMDQDSIAEAERSSAELSALYADLESSCSLDGNNSNRNSNSDFNGVSDVNMSGSQRSVRTPTLFPSF